MSNQHSAKDQNRVIWLKDLCLKDIDKVGGKNASLGEMIQQLSSLGILVPEGFATTAAAYREFLSVHNLDQKIYAEIKNLQVEDLKQLNETGHRIRNWILNAELPKALIDEVKTAYQNMQSRLGQDFSVAVRSSATAEDLPEASFAGQQETFLNIKGIDNILQAIKKVYASLFTDRALAYRVHHGFSHEEVALSVGIQQMVRADSGASGVMFSLDTESGFDQVVFINASYGLGELVVQGSINPDEYYLYKPNLLSKKPALIRKRLGSKMQKMIYNVDTPQTVHETVLTVEVKADQQKQFSLTTAEAEQLGQQALLIEKHYAAPMDIEWAKDGVTQKLYILQARPETVKSRKQNFALEQYILDTKTKILAEGRSVGQRIGRGKAKILRSIQEINLIESGDVLITDMTDPNWEPIMKRASAIVTNRGGRTCHAAIVARELGIPAVVGCGTATETIRTGEAVTVSCAEGDTGYVYQGLLDFQIKRLNLEALPTLPFKIMMTIGNPERAFDLQRLPNAGVGLARLEFLINNIIGVHPRACLEYQKLPLDVQEEVSTRAAGYASPVDFYVNKLTEGMASLASAFWPKPVLIRLSDFKSNEYANLVGGSLFEPKEENPMLGFRGASRYISPMFKECFALECRAIREVRETMGLTNVEVMVPFVRTLSEAEAVSQALKEQGLERGVKGLRIIMMCEVPSNALLAEEFLEFFDGFSIGSNDLTQLTLGLDRDSGLMANSFDERNAAVKFLIERAIRACKKANKTIGICGQGPSDYLDFAMWLRDQGIDSVSLNPDSVIATWLALGNR